MTPRKIVSSLAVFLFLVLFGAGSSFGDELAAVHSAIQQSGAKWIAGETSVSRLSAEERMMRVRLIKPTHLEPGQVLAAPLVHAVALPASLDWRNNNGGNYVTKVKDQGSCGSCWAFASTAAAESAKLIANKTPGTDLNLAEQVLVSCSGAGNCSGGYVDKAANYIRDTGLPPDTCYVYTATNGTCSSACKNWQSSAQKIQSWSWVASTSVTTDMLKQALATYGPLVTTMDVYADFFNYVSGVYSYATGAYQGGHAVLLVGYDDTGKYFIVKNSWGASWGESGYFKIAYSELSSVVKFGLWTIAYTGGSPAPTCTYTVNPTSASVPATAGSGSIGVTTTTACSWTATSGVSWITITSGISGKGNGTVKYAVGTNSTTAIRTGNITVAGNSFIVTQAAAPPAPQINVSPTSINFGIVKLNTTASQTVTVSNSGKAALQVSSTSVSSYFKATATGCSSVAPGGTCTITVTFAPTVTTARTGTLTINSNDPAKKSVAVSLKGSGTK